MTASSAGNGEVTYPPERITTADDYLMPLRANAKVVVAVAILALGAGVAAAVSLPKTYTSTSSILVYPISGDPARAVDISDRTYDMETEARIATSRVVIEAAVQNLAAADVTMEPWMVDDGLRATAIGDTRILDIAFTGSSPGRAQAVTAAATDAYLSYRAELAEVARSRAGTAIEDRIEDLALRLVQVEANIAPLERRSAGNPLSLDEEDLLGLLRTEKRSVEALLGAQEEALATLSTVSAGEAVIETARAPRRPNGLNAIQTVAGAGAGGVVLGILVAYLVAALRTPRPSIATESAEGPSGSARVGTVATGPGATGSAPDPEPAIDPVAGAEFAEPSTEPSPAQPDPAQPDPAQPARSVPAPTSLRRTEPVSTAVDSADARSNPVRPPALPHLRPIPDSLGARAVGDPAPLTGLHSTSIRPTISDGATPTPAPTAVAERTDSMRSPLEELVGLGSEPAFDPQAFDQPAFDPQAFQPPSLLAEPSGPVEQMDPMAGSDVEILLAAATTAELPLFEHDDEPDPATSDQPERPDRPPAPIDPLPAPDLDLMATADLHPLLDQLRHLGAVGPVIVTVLGHREPGPALSVSLDLATALQGLGAQVLLVDTAVDEPLLDRLLDVSTSPGLTDVLDGLLPLSEALQPVDGLPGLDALTTGSDPLGATEVVGPLLDDLLDEARTKYHVTVLIGGALGGLASDDPDRCRELADRADGVVIGTDLAPHHRPIDDLGRRSAELPSPTLALVSASDRTAPRGPDRTAPRGPDGTAPRGPDGTAPRGPGVR